MHYINFSLLQPNSKTESLITLYITKDQERIRVSTKQKVLPKVWDRKKNGITTSPTKLDWYVQNGYGSELQLKNIQHNLNLLRAEVDSFFMSNIENSSGILIRLKLHIQSYLSGEGDKKTDRLLIREYVAQLIGEMQTGYRKKTNGQTYSVGTIECYHTLLQVFIMYEEATKSRKSWDDIDKKFYLSFIQWNESRGVSTNYIGRLIKDMKSIIRTAHEEGLHMNAEYRKRYFAAPKLKMKKIPLSLDEINQLQNLDLKHPSGMSLSRDIFVLGCYVGLRISDLKRIQQKDIQKDGNGYYLFMQTQKTGAEVKIPLNKAALSILQRYDYSFTKYSEQAINRNLKLLGRMVGMDEKRSSTLSMHYARHSFARLAYQQGVPSMFIMRVTGHQSEKTFLTYINISLDEAMDQFRKVALFQ